MDFAYRNVTYDMKQLVEVLWCDVQVTIHEGVMKTQTELLETVGGFVDHFQSEMATLSPPQMHTLLDHLWTRCGGGQAFLGAIWRGETSTRPESFLQSGPSQLCLDFYIALSDHKSNIQKDLTTLSHYKIEVDNAAMALKTQMMDVCSNPVLMLDFKPSVQGVTTIDLTQGDAVVRFPPLKGNMTPSQRNNLDHFNVIPDNTSSVQEEPWTAGTFPPSASSTAPMPSTSAPPSLSPDVQRLPFSLSCIKKVKNLVSKENTCAALV